VGEETGGAGGLNQIPFVLSLSKHCPSSLLAHDFAKEKQPFDKLRVNGGEN
jgi:hypothetical protein